VLSRRVLIAEGATEATSFPVAARRLTELNPATYASVEALGVCIIDGGAESQIADLAKFYKGLGKRTFALCDKQTDEAKEAIEAQVERLFMHGEKRIEDLILKNTTQAALERFADALEWPPHLLAKYPIPNAQAVAALKEYFGTHRRSGVRNGARSRRRRHRLGDRLEIHPVHAPEMAIEILETAAIHEVVVILRRQINHAARAPGLADEIVDLGAAVGRYTNQNLAGGLGVGNLLGRELPILVVCHKHRMDRVGKYHA
jgi:hypothetical protein